MTPITWTKPMLLRFKESYGQAVGERREDFTFDGHLFVTNYARYLIQYLEGKFK